MRRLSLLALLLLVASGSAQSETKPPPLLAVLEFDSPEKALTDGELLRGVRYTPRRMFTQSLSMRSKSGTSGYSFTMRTWQTTGLRSPKLRESS